MWICYCLCECMNVCVCAGSPIIIHKLTNPCKEILYKYICKFPWIMNIMYIFYMNKDVKPCFPFTILVVCFVTAIRVNRKSCHTSNIH